MTIFGSNLLFASGTAGNRASYESRYIVDMPTAGLLPKGMFAASADFFSPNGMNAHFNYGLWKNFNIGLSFGASNFIGTESPEFQSLPGLNVKFRFLDETLKLPAIAIGFSNQGDGEFSQSKDEFLVFSTGFFLTLSKNFSWELGDVALHAGTNYTLEGNHDGFNLNYFFGLEQSFATNAAFCLEYNSAQFERISHNIDAPGLLSASLKYSLGSSFTIELQLRDLLNTTIESDDIERAVSIEYIRNL